MTTHVNRDLKVSVGDRGTLAPARTGDLTSPVQQSSPPRPSGAGEEKLRAGVVGLGRQAVGDHIPALLASDRAELVAICDQDPRVLRQQAESLGVPHYRGYADMFDQEALDFVVVAVPHSAGSGVVLAAAERGVHILKEKPFASSLTEAHELADRCRGAGVQLMMTLQRRFNPIYTSFLQLIDQVGTHLVLDVQYTVHIDDPSQGWRGQVATAGGGCVIDMGYHMVDMILWYFGLPDRLFANVSARARPDRQYDAEDTALVHFGLLAYDAGLYGSLLLSRYIGPKREQLRLTGTNGIVHLERGRLQRLTNGGQLIESLTREPAWPSASTSQINHFASVIAGSRANMSGPHEHLAHMAFIASCYESARTQNCLRPKELLR